MERERSAENKGAPGNWTPHRRKAGNPQDATFALPVLDDMYRLLRMLIEGRSRFDKAYKYVVGDALVSRALECMSLLQFAAFERTKERKSQQLDSFLMAFDVLKTLIMVCRDGSQWKSVGQMADIFERVAKVEVQASSWRRSSRKPECDGAALERKPCVAESGRDD